MRCILIHLRSSLPKEQEAMSQLETIDTDTRCRGGSIRSCCRLRHGSEFGGHHTQFRVELRMVSPDLSNSTTHPSGSPTGTVGRNTPSAQIARIVPMRPLFTVQGLTPLTNPRGNDFSWRPPSQAACGGAIMGRAGWISLSGRGEHHG